ncbi:M20 metallopeptidase family protein [Anaeropeptidivorans aminofermentans]|uniref:M20 metallopeptidase family protein n=1 Tax=Anaeropeptidivorans aminofermentans TaxID=2934315 RepID=UPI002024C3C0|nr:amidohydrolase [Anaeropeptidivorans aminofermentans]
MDIRKEIAEHKEELIALRRDFHQYPELGYKEFNTSKKIVEYLKNIGLEPSIVSKTGVTALIKGKGLSPCVILRVDMDALPQKEQTGLPYASVNEGVMHACGHDGHMAMLLIAAKILCRHKDMLKGSVKLVFQPNEEEAGALDMIHEGILENPEVHAAMGIHLWTPVESGKIGVSPGPVMAATEEFEMTIKGKGGHTSEPHRAVDTILAASALIQSLQTLQTRENNPLNPLTIMVGKINGGTGRNIISDKVEMGGTIRFHFPNEKTEKKELMDKFQRVIKGVCETYGTEYEIKFIPSNPTLMNDEKIIQTVRKAAMEVYGKEDAIVEYRCMAGEDFAEFSQRVPSAFYFVGTGNKEKKTDFPHHHPSFNIDEDSLALGVEMHIKSLLGYFDSVHL